MERIYSEALRPRQKEFLSTITHVGVINISTEAYRASNKVSKAAIEPFYQSINKQIATSIATEVLDVSSDVASEVKLKVDNFMSPIASYVVVEDKKKSENRVISVSKSIQGSNTKSIEATKCVVSHGESIQSSAITAVVAAKTITVSVSTHTSNYVTNSIGIVKRVVSLSAYIKPLESRSSANKTCRAYTKTFAAMISGYAVARDNNGISTRYVKSHGEAIHSYAVMTHGSAMPIVVLSELDNRIKLHLEEPRVLLRAIRR